MTTNGTAHRPTQMSGQILTEAARRMLPVLAGRVLAAAADRAVETVDRLAERIDERRTGAGTSAEDDPATTDAPREGTTSPGRTGAAFTFVMEAARRLLAFVARLAAQAVELLRRATERLRERRAPEGIDEAPEPEEVAAPEDLDAADAEDDGLQDDPDDEFDDEIDEGVEDDPAEERATVGA